MTPHDKDKTDHAVTDAPSTAGAASQTGLGVSRTATDLISDYDLLIRIAADERDAFEILYARYAHQAHSLAGRICLDHGLAETVVQEVFLMVWRGCSRYTPSRGPFLTWLLTVVHHRAVDALRHESVVRRHSAHGMAVSSRPGPGADEDALQLILSGHVRAALGQLSEEQRRALLLAYYGGYTQREISEMLGIPLGTVKSRMFAGAQRLRTVLRSTVDPPSTT